MENYNYEELAHESDYMTNKWPVYASDDEDEEELEADEEESSTEWGDVDPAGGPAPTSPGSAV